MVITPGLLGGWSEYSGRTQATQGVIRIGQLRLSYMYMYAPPQFRVADSALWLKSRVLWSRSHVCSGLETERDFGETKVRRIV
jgi:hypothetical protein